MTSVLVTGGAGYIGSHCCCALRAAGFTPVVFDDFSTGHRSFVQWGPAIEGDIRDRKDLLSAVRTVKPAAIMHFAARSIVPHSVERPDETFDVNVTGTLNLLKAALQHNVKKVVFSSTCAVYGLPASLPVTEGTSAQPINPYGASKAMSERMFDDIGAAYGVRIIKLRYFNAAGADPYGRVGEWHEPETHLIPLVLDTALGLRPAITVFGDDYDTPDGTAIRDYIHVNDLADAHVLALRYLMDGGASVSLNVGTGVGISVNDVIATTERVTGLHVPRTVAPRRAGDPPILMADPSAATATLDWRPKRDFETIVSDAWAWHQTLRATERRAIA